MSSRPFSVVEQVKDRLSMVDVVGRAVPLKQNGNGHVGNCPCGCGAETGGRFKRGHNRRVIVVPPYYDEVDTGYTSPCHLWRYGKDADGYGTIRGAKAHRLFYEAAKGPIAPGLDLDHLCRVPACVNPEHLEPVTHAVNIRRGVSAKLTAVQVAEIRAAVGVLQRDLAAKYGVSSAHICKIRSGRKWREAA